MATLFVNGTVAGGDNDGTSWADAYTDLSTALANAQSGDEIWVAQGTYTPGVNQSDTFTINQDIAIYGGFSGNGTETSIDERDFEANPTILSGDIGVIDDSSDNVHHVVTSTSSTAARLDGLIVEDGNTTGDTSNTDGGGVRNTGSLIIENSIVRDNIASDDGGGISNSGTLTVSNSTISNNTAQAESSDFSGGGGLLNTRNATATIVSSTFSNNQSDKNGGAVRNDGTLELVASTISGNTADESGGGIVNTRNPSNPNDPADYADLTVVASTITNNLSTNTSGQGGGGGISNFGNVTLGNSIIAANTGNDDLRGAFSYFIFTFNGTFTTLGSNLIGNGEGISGFMDGQNGDQVGTATTPINPLIDALADNGGFTETHALQSNSPASGEGDNSIVLNLSESALGVDLNNDGDVDDTIDTVGDLLPDSGGTVSIGGFEVQECFLAGTLILTEAGEKPVENLKVGDRLPTLSGQLESIKWIGLQTYHRATAHPLRSNPIQIKAGALGDNLPQSDLFVSPDHALLVDGLLINAGALTNGSSIVQIQPEADRFVYYHIELQHHALLIAEGTAAESYLPQKHDRTTFDNAEEYEMLYAEQTLISLLPMNYPRVSSKRQLPRFVAKRLEKLGRSLYAHPSSHQSA